MDDEHGRATPAAIDRMSDDSVRADGASHVSVVRVEVPESVAKWLLLFLICVCLLALVLAAVAMVNSFEIAPRQVARASEAVDRANDRLEDNTRYLVQVAYWGQRAEVAATNAGIKLPPFPQPSDRRKQ